MNFAKRFFAKLQKDTIPFVTGKLVEAMMNSEVFIKTDIDQSVIAVSPIGMNDSIWCYMPANNGLQCGSEAIRNTLCIYFSWALQDIKNNCFTISTSTSFTSDTLRTKIRLIDFYSARKRRFKFAAPGNSLSNIVVNLDQVIVLTDRIEISVNCAVLVAVKPKAI